MIHKNHGFGTDADGSDVAAKILVCITAFVAVLFLAAPSQATSLTWDSGGASPANPADGSGTWDTTAARWSNGGSDAVWNNANKDTAVFGNTNGAAGTVTLGTAITAGGLTFNAPGSGMYVIGSGTFGNSGTLTLTGATNPIPIASTVYIAKAATLNLGTAQTIGNLQDGTGGGGTIAQLWTVGTNVLTVQSGSFSGLIKDSNSSRLIALTKSTGGTLTLSATNTYTGPTLVNGGVLLINGMSTGSAVTVSGGATLGGTGKVYGPTGAVYAVTTVATNSHISPGNSGAGTLTLRSLDATSGAGFVFRLGTTQNLLAVTGAFTGSSAASGLVFDFSNAGGLAAKTAYTLINFGSATGLDYTDLLANTLPSGFVLDTSFGGGGNGFKINANSLQVQFAAKSTGTIVLMR